MSAPSALRPDAPLSPAQHPGARSSGWLWLPAIVTGFVALVAASYPVARAFYLTGFGFNEGWNVFAAQMVFHGQKVYAHPPAWTDFNYPALSFHIVAWLHALGASYLFAGRFLSLGALLASCLLVAWIAHRLGAAARHAVFAGLFCLAIFAIAARSYVGLDDPQILAQMFFLAGLYVYVSGEPSWGRLAAVAALFVIGGNIKHNLVDFPLAVLLDLLLTSRRAAVRFIALGVAFLGISIAWEIWANGPYFVANLLSARRYLLSSAWLRLFRWGVAPVEIAAIAAALWSLAHLRPGRARVVAVWFWCALGVGFIFGGGDGVGLNSYFDWFLATAIIAALFIPWLMGRQQWMPRQRAGRRAELAIPLVLLLSLGPAWFRRSTHYPHKQFHLTDMFKLPGRQTRFQLQVRFLRQHPGPALCTDLLLCARAGKPYVYDPFDASERVLTGQLNPAPLVDRVRRQQFSVIQVLRPVAYYQHITSVLIFPPLADAIAHHYRLAFHSRRSYIYVPRRGP
ncbi:MAG: hypothetical protein ACRD2E_09300 [Terriglobales bacterium]